MVCEQCQSVELLSNEELIEELLNRSTFLGVVIRSAKQIKNNDEHHEDFVLSYTDVPHFEIKKILRDALICFTKT